MSFTTETVEIGGRNFTIRKLALVKQRVVYARFQKLLGVFAQREELAQEGMSAFMTATMANLVSQEDMQFFCDQFGPSTSVEWDAERTLILKDPAHQEIAFGEDYTHQFEWLDACFALNFAGVLGKLSAALQSKRDEASAASQTE